uniref:Cytochrome P450 n=1 Tax=Acrobeloides nanus TaxID=290746 RepID=A0A914CLM1_9BILA
MLAHPLAILSWKYLHIAKYVPVMSYFYNRMPQLVNMCFDLWMSGQETTTNSISWGVIHLMLAQSAQARLQAELDSVIGSDRMIVMEDRPNLPYTCAAVNEIQRMANIFFFVLKTATKDGEIRGHKIKKGTAVVPMIYLVLDDET